MILQEKDLNNVEDRITNETWEKLYWSKILHQVWREIIVEPNVQLWIQIDNKFASKIHESKEIWLKYKRKGLSEMRPYLNGDDLSYVSISEADLKNGSPKQGDMIARNPKNHEDQWLVASKYFQDNFLTLAESEI